ncbi:hypothetical protein CBR_g21918 [Chara braunii]|uniref:Integrase catalytic domain-containing protein n=2 Tax=Chara braunii TaxID=69332 RepID=A0A388L1K1_CHABU|nr:hypothetical protein CBR_g21918 [Chara braunii]|eukprot:GBG76169.1 hypothetical protein CBR_g21918 [Chara braunii]
MDEQKRQYGMGYSGQEGRESTAREFQLRDCTFEGWEPRQIKGGVEMPLPAEYEWRGATCDWIGLEIVPELSYLWIECIWNPIREEDGWEDIAKGKVESVGTVVLSEQGWHLFCTTLAAGQNPMWLLEGAEMRTQKAGERFANKGWDEVHYKVVMGGWKEFRPPCSRKRIWVPEFIMDWFGGFYHVAEVADTMERVHIDYTWFSEEFYKTSLKYGPFHGDRVWEALIILNLDRYDQLEVAPEVRDAIIRREVAATPCYVDDVFKLFEVLCRVCITPEGIEDAEPIDAFLEYEGGTLVVDNEMANAAPTTSQLLIQTLEKGAPAVVAELREGPVTTFSHKGEKDAWGAAVRPKEELMAMVVEGGRDAVMTLIETWAQREWRSLVNQTQEEQDADRKEREFFLIQMYEGIFREIGLLLIGNKQPKQVSPKAREEAEKYILDARDNLSGYVEAVTLKRKTGKGVADWIEDFYLRHPFVRRFIVDNGTEFVNHEVLSRLKTLCVPIKIIEPYHSEANAPVERGHQTLKNTIAKLAADDLANWPRYLKQAVFSENMTPKKTTGCIPVELWYGREIDFPMEALVPTWNRLDDNPHMSTDELIAARCQQVVRNEEALEDVVRRVMDSRMRDKARWDQVKNIQKEPLQVGEKVLVRNSTLESRGSGQLGKRFKGPYRVAKRVGLNTFELEDLDGTRIKGPFLG